MRNYTFRYVEGSSGPSHTISAENHVDFYYQLCSFLAEKPGRSLIPNTIRFSEYGAVLDPPLVGMPAPQEKVRDFNELGRHT